MPQRWSNWIAGCSLKRVARKTRDYLHPAIFLSRHFNASRRDCFEAEDIDITPSMQLLGLAVVNFNGRRQPFALCPILATPTAAAFGATRQS
jgi:hypothetical protein